MTPEQVEQLAQRLRQVRETPGTATPPFDVRDRFVHHPPPTQARVMQHELVRGMCLSLAGDLDALLPPGREKALALTKLEEAMFWANAALARQGGQG